MKKDIKILYKNIDITKDVGSCVCDNCLKHIKIEVDKDLKENEDV